jgi:hypothetical protein
MIILLLNERIYIYISYINIFLFFFKQYTWPCMSPLIKISYGGYKENQLKLLIGKNILYL